MLDLVEKLVEGMSMLTALGGQKTLHNAVILQGYGRHVKNGYSCHHL